MSVTLRKSENVVETEPDLNRNCPNFSSFMVKYTIMCTLKEGEDTILASVGEGFLY